MIKKVVLEKEKLSISDKNIYCLINDHGEIFKLNYFSDFGYLFVSLRDSICSFGCNEKNISILFQKLKDSNSWWCKNKIYEFENEKQFAAWYYAKTYNVEICNKGLPGYKKPKELRLEDTVCIDDVDLDNKIYTFKSGNNIYKIHKVENGCFCISLNNNEYWSTDLTFNECIENHIINNKAIYESDNIFEAIELYKNEVE